MTLVPMYGIDRLIFAVYRYERGHDSYPVLGYARHLDA